MGLFDSVLDFLTGERNEEQSRTISTTTDTDTQRTSISGQTAARARERGATTAGESTAATTREETLSQLDPETQELLRNLIQDLGGGVGGPEDNVVSAINELQQLFAGEIRDARNHTHR